LLEGRKWKESGLFPRVTFCDVDIRQPGNIRNLKFTLQCVLMINMFNEKVYILVWIWLLVLSVMNFISCIRWCWIALSWSSSMSFVESHLNGMKLVDIDPEQLSLFVKKYLGRDGCTTLRLIGQNCGGIICYEIIHNLWTNFDKNQMLAQKFRELKRAQSEKSRVSEYQERGTIRAGDMQPYV